MTAYDKEPDSELPEANDDHGTLEKMPPRNRNPINNNLCRRVPASYEYRRK